MNVQSELTTFNPFCSKLILDPSGQSGAIYILSGVTLLCLHHGRQTILSNTWRYTFWRRLQYITPNVVLSVEPALDKSIRYSVLPAHVTETLVLPRLEDTHWSCQLCEPGEISRQSVGLSVLTRTTERTDVKQMSPCLLQPLPL